MALFGLRCEPRQACDQALAAALAFAGEVHKLNTALRGELAEPIGFGIGLHCGRAIVGEIGFHEHTTFTALGDVVNVAARLESATRRLGCQAVVSDDVMRLAGSEWPDHPEACIEIAGGNAPVAVHLLDLGAALADGRSVSS
jgi:adenylate cyclase